MTWPTIELGDVADVVMGQSPPGETYNENGEGLPFFQGKADFGERFPDARKWCTVPKKVAEPGDILLSVRAPVGPTNIAVERSCIGRRLAAIRGNPERVDQSYLRLFLQYREKILAFKGQGSTFPAIGRADIETLSVPLPSLSEQRQIVGILDQANHLLQLRSEADEMTERLLPVLLTRILGSPEAWPGDAGCKTLGSLASFVSGATPSKSVEGFWRGSVPWVSAKDMKTDFLSDSQDHVSETAVEETNLRLIKRGSALVLVRGMILARTIPLAINLSPVTINQDMKALLPKRKPITGAYLWAVLTVAKQQLRGLVRTAGHGTRKLDTPDLMRFRIPVPNPDQIQQVSYAVETHRHLVESRQKSALATNRLFRLLLSRAFSGSLTSVWRKSQAAELLEESSRGDSCSGHMEGVA